MTGKSKTVALDIARIAVRPDHRYDSDLLEEVFAYCWDQLSWRMSDPDLIALRQKLKMDGEEWPPTKPNKLWMALTCHPEPPLRLLTWVSEQ